MIAVAVIAVVFAVCFVVMAYALLHAPQGYQDEDGFHYGEQPRRRFEPGLHVVRDLSYFGQQPDGAEPRWPDN